MKFKILILLTYVFTACPTWANTDETVENILEELDEVIANKPLYHAQKEAGLDELKLQLKNAKDYRTYAYRIL
mgnify:FL=1